MRSECLNNRYAYDTPIPVSRLVTIVGSSILLMHGLGSQEIFSTLIKIAFKMFNQSYYLVEVHLQTFQPNPNRFWFQSPNCIYCNHNVMCMCFSWLLHLRATSLHTKIWPQTFWCWSFGGWIWCMLSCWWLSKIRKIAERELFQVFSINKSKPSYTNMSFFSFNFFHLFASDVGW